LSNNLLRVEIDRLRARRALVEGRLQAALLKLKSITGTPLSEAPRLGEELAAPTSMTMYKRQRRPTLLGEWGAPGSRSPRRTSIIRGSLVDVQRAAPRPAPGSTCRRSVQLHRSQSACAQSGRSATILCGTSSRRGAIKEADIPRRRSARRAYDRQECGGLSETRWVRLRTDPCRGRRYEVRNNRFRSIHHDGFGVLPIQSNLQRILKKRILRHSMRR
jgi:hypothetical protein